ncbi:MAG: N-acetyltransferase [Bacteroidetes bacterium]|nr:MAG: N-acetyltransferase [Bacteroidota bacterium]
MEIPTLETDRLRLRPASLKDAPWMFTLRSSPAFMEFMNRPLLKDVSEAEAFLQNVLDRYANDTGVQWILELKSTGEPIGYAGMWRWEKSNRLAEVGYGMDLNFVGHGYMTEAVKACLAYGYEHMNIHRMEAYARTSNKASIRVLEKCGFHKEGTLRHCVYFEEEFFDLYLFSLLSNEVAVGQ